MRNKFDEQLEELNVELIKMGALCESAIAAAAKSIFEADPSLSRKAIEADNKVDRKEKEIEAMCLRLLLQQQPVARDLRVISSALKMISDMERIGDQASDIAEISNMIQSIARKDNIHLRDMARATIKMVSESISSFVKKDLELANAVVEYDDVVDGLFAKVRGELIDLIGSNPQSGELYVDYLMIAKYFERIGDHATNIAEWVIYSITGRHVYENVGGEGEQA